MYKWRVRLTYMTHYVVADDYSVAGGLYMFWVKQDVVRSFPEEDVIEVTRIGVA